MKPANITKLSDSQLVERFAEIALAQDEALLNDEIGKFNRLYGRMQDVENELRSRTGDKRKLLKRLLYVHPNAQVRLKAATKTLAIALEAARKVLQEIIDAHEFPQALDAGMLLGGLDDGSFKPT
ncbi:MAG: DUF2019 domain-containing protein [Hyphomicrobiales bacterium]